jgi:hypothetical protein
MLNLGTETLIGPTYRSSFVARLRCERPDEHLAQSLASDVRGVPAPRTITGSASGLASIPHHDHLPLLHCSFGRQPSVHRGISGNIFTPREDGWSANSCTPEPYNNPRQHPRQTQRHILAAPLSLLAPANAATPEPPASSFQPSYRVSAAGPERFIPIDEPVRPRAEDRFPIWL